MGSSVTHIDVVCTNPPGGPDDLPAVFVELEDDQRRSTNVGEWLERDDGYWVLRILTGPSSW